MITTIQKTQMDTTKDVCDQFGYRCNLYTIESDSEKVQVEIVGFSGRDIQPDEAFLLGLLIASAQWQYICK